MLTFNMVSELFNRDFLENSLTALSKPISVLDRFKMIFELTNIDQAGLDLDDWLFARAANCRHVLTRPEHSFFAPPDLSYMEVNCNMHAYSPASRARLELLKHNLPQCDVNMALLIEGKENDELPEQVLGAIGIRGLDFLDPGMAKWPNGHTRTRNP